MRRVELEVTITLRAPFLFPSQDPARFGIDRVAKRNRGGCLIIPEDTMRGALRDMTYRIAALGDQAEPDRQFLDTIFGLATGDSRGSSTGSMAPRATNIFFTDLVAPKSAEIEAPFPRLKVNDVTGAAEPGHLLLLETSALPEENVTFQGRITAFADKSEQDRLTRLVRTGLRSIRQLGAYETIGFGHVISADLAPVHETAFAQSCKLEPGRVFEWQFFLDRPYLVDADRVSDNVFVGTRRIPGGALKGCLIRNLELYGSETDACRTQLAKLRVGFADLEDGYAPLPLSTGVVRGDKNTPSKVVDLVRHKDVRAIQAVDWKDEDRQAVLQDRGIIREPKFEYDERVHVMIDAKRGIAQEEMLFSTVAIDAADQPFTATLDLTSVTDTNLISALSEVLSNGLVGLGKTNAQLRSKVSKESPQAERQSLEGNIRCRITLLTDALLAAPDGKSSAWDLYAKSWEQLLPGASLNDFHAEQKLVGGYQARRYNTQKDGIYPFILTSAGSVFEITLPSAQVHNLEGFAKLGIVTTQQCENANDWQNCPFVPENGYGQIEVSFLQAAGVHQ